MHSLAKSFVMIINEYFNLMILLLDIGTVCDFRLSYGRVLNKKSKIIAVNRNKSQLFKVSHTVACTCIYILYIYMQFVKQIL